MLLGKNAPLRVLAVDDEADIRALYRSVLDAPPAPDARSARQSLEKRLFGAIADQPAGTRFELTTCGNAQLAMEALKQSYVEDRPFAVAFLDVRMPPGMDGVQLAQWIREKDTDIELVLVTGFEDYGPQEIISRLPPPDKLLYLHKPFHKSEILQFATSLCAKWQATQQLTHSEARFRHIVQDQTELICRLSAKCTFTFVNATFAAFFDQSEDVLINTPYFAVVHPDEQEKVRQLLDGLSLDKPNNVLEHRVLDASGSGRWLQQNYQALFKANGKFIEYQIVGRDITERIAVDKKLRDYRMERERTAFHLETIFHNIPFAVAMIDDQLRIIESNEAFTELPTIRHIAPADVAGHLFLNFFTCDISGKIQEALQSNTPFHEWRATCDSPEGHETIFSITAIPLKEIDEKGSGCMVLLRDVTRSVRLEHELIEHSRLYGMMGKSQAMAAVFERIRQFAEVDTTVLITGENGTGKELVAEALHQGGSRAGGPLIKLNCAALSESLLESELFGHVKGAFTGATADKIGRFEAAQGGTLLLDEIGDLPMSIQLKLLRVLEYKEFERVGETRSRKVDVRLLAATNRNLEERIRQGAFREDLYFRLKVVSILLPPLRERSEDIPLLAAHFIMKYASHFHKNLEGPTPAAMEALLRHTWPGNVRELKHALEHACIMAPPGAAIDLPHLPEELFNDGNFNLSPADSPDLQELDEAAEKQAILAALEQARWNKSAAAELLGINRRTLYRKLEKYAIF